ncbi:MAG: transferrin-binding protein-like solute binding protein [Neisseriaceae bacterium]|nr:transferrin-binding protein-like solute binding protein [Neisseriaceae bacterium]
MSKHLFIQLSASLFVNFLGANTMRASVLTLTTLLALTLTACGGGGGSSDNPNQSPVVVNPPTNGGGGSGGNTTPTPTTDGFVVSGKAIKFENGKQVAKMDSYARTEEIKIDGKTMTLFHNKQGELSYTTNTKYSSADGHIAATAGRLAYSRFGVMHDEDKNIEYVFYTGKENLTPVSEMPTTGTKVKYSGYAVAYRPNDQRTFLSYFAGGSYDTNRNTPVTFDVNFVEKTITGKIDELNSYKNDNGTLSTKQIKNIELSATITGNTFSGTKNGVSTEGIFVGPKAAEMTGLFKDDNNRIQGAFGAKKQ